MVDQVQMRQPGARRGAGGNSLRIGVGTLRTGGGRPHGLWRHCSFDGHRRHGECGEPPQDLTKEFAATWLSLKKWRSRRIELERIAEARDHGEKSPEALAIFVVDDVAALAIHCAPLLIKSNVICEVSALTLPPHPPRRGPDVLLYFRARRATAENIRHPWMIRR